MSDVLWFSDSPVTESYSLILLCVGWSRNIINTVHMSFYFAGESVREFPETGTPLETICAAVDEVSREVHERLRCMACSEVVRLVRETFDRILSRGLPVICLVFDGVTKQWVVREFQGLLFDDLVESEPNLLALSLVDEMVPPTCGAFGVALTRLLKLAHIPVYLDQLKRQHRTQSVPRSDPEVLELIGMAAGVVDRYASPLIDEFRSRPGLVFLRWLRDWQLWLGRRLSTSRKLLEQEWFGKTFSIGWTDAPLMPPDVETLTLQGLSLIKESLRRVGHRRELHSGRLLEMDWELYDPEGLGNEECNQELYLTWYSRPDVAVVWMRYCMCRECIISPGLFSFRV